MYRLHGELWPQKDPITGCQLCHFCWNRDHARCGQMHDEWGIIKCDCYAALLSQGGSRGRRPLGCECQHQCDCHCRMEAAHANQERVHRLELQLERRRVKQAQLEDASNPLRSFSQK